MNLTRNKKIGLFWLIGPTVGLVLILVVHSIVSYILRDSGVSGLGDPHALAKSLLNVMLGFLGIINVFLIILGAILGVYYLRKDENIPSVYDERSGKGEASEVPAEIKGWSWGAFILSWIWGIFNNVWLSFLVLVPFFGWIWPFILGAKGKKWAWQQKRWASVEEFKRVQKKWNAWGLGIFIFNIVLYGLVFSIVFNSVDRAVTSQTPSHFFICKDNKIIQAKFNHQPVDSVDLTLSDGRVLQLPHAISADGARYANQDESFVFWNKGNTAFIQENNQNTFQDCIIQEDN